MLNIAMYSSFEGMLLADLHTEANRAEHSTKEAYGRGVL
jgi:hypothetical protein